MGTVGFIGAGNIATAIMHGMSIGGMDMSDVLVYSVIEREMESLKTALGIVPAHSNIEVVQNCQYVFLAIRSENYQVVMNEVASSITDRNIFISPTPGYTISEFKKNFGEHVKVVRIMPNTASFVGEGMTGLCIPPDTLSEQESKDAQKIMSFFGQVELLPEHLMDIIVSLSGSSPAYVYMMIEAMGDAGVSIGLSRKLSYKLASQALIGAATMVRDTGRHPGELKDDVCTPGGTTIQAVRVLEQRGFRSALFEAMLKCHFAAEDSKR